MTRLPFLAAALVLAAPLAAQRTAVRAGTIHLVEAGEVLMGGGTVLVEDGRIVAVGKDVTIPPDAEVVDYGPDAVLVPGLVAADSALLRERPSDRTADPNLRAIDGFDFYEDQSEALAAGVTSAYLTPARNRLIAGQGAVVKLARGDSSARVLAAPAALHGAISEEARHTPGFWEPPIPATSDVGIGAPLEQLPRTTMGAVVALEELLEIARAGEDDERYGPGVAETLAAVLEADLPWRITAREEDELRALLAFREATGVPLVVHGADEAGRVAHELAAAGVHVVYETAFRPEIPGVDRGKATDSRWPDYGVPSRLAAAGVPVAIHGRGSWDLRFAAALSSRGGLDPEAALRAVTLAPAEAYGVAHRVGSLAPGKDADLCVLNGPPLEVGSSVLATWVDGEVVWGGRASESSAVVIEVDELHVGDGRVLRPGQLLLQDGRIAEVGEAVGRPGGARVVRGRAAMPGMVDALGHLGLEGSTKVPGTDFRMQRIVGPGDHADRRVARAGVTTVVMSPREASNSGAPMLAYKPAAASDQRQVVRDPVALRLQWRDDNRYESGEDVRELLEEAVEYDREWREYEEALAKWKEQPPAPEDAGDEDGEEEDGDEDGDEEEEEDESEGDEGDEGAEGEESSVTGLWTGSIRRPPLTTDSPLRLRLLEEEGAVRGSLRCEALSDDLVRVEGWYGEDGLSLNGLGSQGFLRLDAKLVLPEDGGGKRRKKDGDDAEPPRLAGAIEIAGEEIAIELALEEPGYPVAARPGPAVGKEERAKDEPEDEPEEPRRDEDLEPLRRAMAGEATVVVAVEREDEILDCVEAFRKASIRPVLLGASDAYLVAERIAPHVAGVLPTQPIVAREPTEGLEGERNRYAELQAAGIPVAFSSLAEEGAADLPLMAAFAVSQGMSPTGALRALTADAARMFFMADRVGLLERGRDADVLVLDGSPVDVTSSVERVFVNGEEVL